MWQAWHFGNHQLPEMSKLKGNQLQNKTQQKYLSLMYLIANGDSIKLMP